MQILWPWKIAARYEDGFETVVNGNSDEDCMCKVDDLTYQHGACVWYSGYCDADYDYVDGEYVGRENLIYD